MEPKTIDEYQELVKELKAKLRKVEKKNLELVIKLTDKTKANEKEVKGANIEQAISLNKKAVKIQSVWRGYRQRRAFRQELRKIAKSDLRGGVKINTNSTALAEIETAVKKIGLNLEMLFRACDSEGKGQVTLEEFKLFLKRLNLKKVSQAQINRFLHAIDEDCTGIISREEYHNCLAAYGVHAEASKTRSSTRTYEQECVIKFAAVLKARDVRPEEVYNFCDVDQTGTVGATQLAKFIGNLSEPFQEKEIRGLVQYLDVDNNKKIPREVFIRELEKGMRVAGDDYKFKSPSRVDRYDDDDNAYRSPPKKIGSFGVEDESPTEYEKRIKKGTKKPIELTNSQDFSSGPKKNVDTPQFKGSLGFKDKEEPRVIKPVVVKKPVVKEKPQESAAEAEVRLLKKIIVKMEMASKPIYLFLEKLLLGMKDVSKGITEAELRKALDQDYAKELTQDERVLLIKDLDLNSNKTVDAAEIKSFYINLTRQSKEKVVSSKLLLISVAKSVDAEKKSTEDFLKGYGIMNDKRYSVDEFQQKLNALFDLPDEASDVYKEFNDRGTGTVNVAGLVETINSYRTANVEVKKPATGVEKKPAVVDQADPNVTVVKKIISKMEMEDKPIYQFLENLLLSVKDPSQGVTSAEIQKILDSDYKTALTQSEKSALLKALDVNKNDNIDVMEAKQFLISASKQSKEKVVSTKLVLITIAKYADMEKKSTADYLKAYGITGAKQFTIGEFRKKLTPSYDLKEDDARELFVEFKDNKTGNVDLNKVVQAINSFRQVKGGESKPEQNNVKDMDSAEITNKALKKIIVEMEMESKPIYLFLEKLLLAIKDSKVGISQAEALKLLANDYPNKVLSEQERLTLISVLDQNTNGVVDFFEVKKFYITMARQSKEKVVSSKLLLISVAKTADTEKKSTEDFLKGYGILSNKRYTVDEFQQKLNPLFDLPDEAADVYNEFNDRGTDTVNVANLIQTIDSFRGIQKSSETKTNTKKTDIQKAPAVLPENVKDLLGIQIVETIEKTPKLETKDFKKALVKLELEDSPIHWLLELLLQEMRDPKKGLPRIKVKELIKEKTGDILTEVMIDTILQKLDSDQEGVINVDDVQSFINSNAPMTKEVMVSKELIIIMFAKLAQAELLNTDKFFEKYGIRTYKKVSLAEFKNKMSEVIKLPSHYEAELWDEFNHNGTGFVEIDEIMAAVNEHRTDLSDKGKVSYKASVQNIFEHLIYKTIIDDDQERVALESRAKNEETMETFKKILKDKGIKPLEFFNVASKGSPTCTAVAFRNAVLLYKTSLTDDDLSRIIKNIDVNQNQTLDLKFYEMVFMDDEALQSFKTKSRGPRGAEEIDPASLGKIKDLLSELNKTTADFFKECDTKGTKEITLVQLKAGMRRMFPCSRLHYSDVLKVMRSMDVQYTGVVTEKTFNSVMSKAKSGGNIINEITKAINSVNDDNAQAEDLKDAIKKLKTVISNPKYQNKPEDLFKLFDLDKDAVVTREEFLKALDGLDSKVFLSERQKVLLVNLADKNKNNQIEYAEFLDLVSQVNPDMIKEPKKDTLKISMLLERRASRSSKPSSVAEILDNIDQEANEQNFAKYMESIRLSASDYYRSDSTTILNNQIAALKRCYEIIKEMEKGGVQAFDDPDFGPKNEKDHAETSIYANPEERPGGYPDPENILWFRLKEICPDKRPVFLDLDVNTNDVIQGEIGDCWLIGGFSVLATQDDYIRGFFDASAAHLKEMKDKEMTDDEAYGMQTGLYPPMFHWLRKYGIYVIRFFRDYSWRYVIIDDKLPCYKYEEDSAPVLVFGKCRNHNEFWVPILEKAYAKLHSCYENLIAGYIDDGLADMTGLVANKFILQGPNGFPSSQVGSAEALWQKLMEFRMNNTMLGCSVKGNPGETEHEVVMDGEPVGILKNHAYSIIDVIELPNPNARNAHKSHRLLRIRNPWGTKEWTGKWSDGSPKLLQNIARLNGYLRERAKKKKIEEFDPEADDGTFLICYKDWRYIYHNLYCCVNFPDEWSGVRFEDEWTSENSGGTPLKPDPDNVKAWAKNPQFVVTINNKTKKTTKLFISLGQKDGRTVRGMKFPFKDNINAVVFTVASLKAGEKKLEAFDGSRIKKLSAIKEYRDVSVDIELENGTYVIVPSTQRAGSTGKFFLSVYFECTKEEITIKKAGSDLKGEVIQEEEETALTTDKDLKAVLKLKTLAVLCEDEMEASLERSLSKMRKDSGGASIMEGGSINSISSPLRKVKSQTISGKGGDKTPRSVMDSEQANKMFNDIMRGIGLNDSDFFRQGCTTILNSGMAALKRCHEILRQMNQDEKRIWIDTEFGPPTNEEAGLEFICSDPENPPYWIADPERTGWLHIKDVCPPEKHPHFLAHGADSGDVIQGQVGDCWFIGAMSVLASNSDAYIRGNFKPTDDNLTEIDDAEAEAMTKGVYPPMFHWLRQFGIYVLRFFKNYGWRYVIIDDRIPCLKEEDDSHSIIYGKCKADDEFWVPLIEKAFAKLHYTYEALVSGYLDDGLTDMTGMASDKIKIQDTVGANDQKKKDDFWKFLLEKNKQGSMMGCSIQGKPGETEHELVVDGERMGILKSHAYSVIDVFELPAPEAKNYHKSHRILRIRNPWGNKEWQGKWSDKSSKFADKIHKIEKYMREEKIRDPEYEILDTNATDDGTFLMCYKDWRTYYTTLFMCIDFPPQWSGYRFKDQWTKDNSGGFPSGNDATTWAKNPQFILEVPKPANIFVSLGQTDGRLDKGTKFPFAEKINPAILFVVKLNQGEEKEGVKAYDQSRVLKMTQAKQYRDNTMFVDLPEAGAYALIPSTKLPRQVGDFFLNIYCGLNKTEFKLYKAKSNLKYEMILEEEEGGQHFDDNLKLVLKLKAREVIYESEAYLQEKTLSQIFD